MSTLDVVEDPEAYVAAMQQLKPPRFADLAVRFPEATSHSSKLVPDGSNFFAKIADDINAAEHSVAVMQFGFKPGIIGETFAALLARKARAGVRVAVSVDAWGSKARSSSRKMLRTIADAGAVVVTNHAITPFWSPGHVVDPRRFEWNPSALGRIDHRKCIVIDGRVAWIGGAGFEDHFRDGSFFDLFVRTEGSVVGQLQAVILSTIVRCRGDIGAASDWYWEQAHDDHPANAVTVLNAPSAERPLSDAFARVIDDAQSSLDIINPYVTDRAMADRMAAAAQRGVNVRLLVPAKPNNPLCRAAQIALHGGLLSSGVDIAEHPEMLHAKACVADGRTVLVGSCNLDAGSLKNFWELNIRLRDESLAAEFADKIFNPGVEQSTSGAVPTGVGRLVGKAARLASPIL